MKILVYIEPHPIRNEMTHFKDIAALFKDLCTSTRDEVKIYSNHEIINFIDKEESYRNHIIPTIRVERELFETLKVNWVNTGINLWLDLVNKGKTAELYLPILRRIYRSFPFDVLISWGENGTIRLFQQEQNFTAINMELGCTREPFFDSVIMDPFGTNGAGLIPKIDIKDIKTIVNGDSLSAENAILCFTGRNILGYEQQFEPLDSDLYKQISTNQPKVFFPLQLFDDINLLHFSPYNSLVEVVSDVVPKLVEAGYLVIIKPHPSSNHRQGALFENLLAKNSLSNELNKNIIWCDLPNTKYNNIPLIQLCDFVVTVNSSVGFEALFYDKPTVVLGEAVYKPKNMFPNLEDILSGSFNEEIFRENAGYLRKFLLEAYLIDKNIFNQPYLLLEHLHLIHNSYHRTNHNPAAIARDIYQYRPFMETFAKKNMALDSSEVKHESSRSKAKIEKEPVSNPYTDVEPIVKKMIALSGAKEYHSFEIWLHNVFENTNSKILVFKDVTLLDENYYLSNNPDLEAAGIIPLVHYVSHGYHEGRVPSTKFVNILKSYNLYDAILFVGKQLFDSDKVLSVGLTPKESTERENQLSSIREQVKDKNNKVAVVAHMYYRNLVPKILDSLKNITQDFDLYVTLPTLGSKLIMQEIKEHFPNTLFYQSVNRGRDIGPFIDLLPIIIDKEYSSVLKIQTKFGFFHEERFITDYSDIWFKDTLTTLLGDSNKITKILNEFENDSNLNIVGINNHYLSLNMYPYSDHGDFVQNLFIEDIYNKNGGFFAGTMFWFRPSYLQPLIKKAKLTIESFNPETGSADGEIAHIIERALGHLATIQGGKAVGLNLDSNLENVFDYELQPSTVSLLKHFEQRKKELNSLYKDSLTLRFGV